MDKPSSFGSLFLRFRYELIESGSDEIISGKRW